MVFLRLAACALLLVFSAAAAAGDSPFVWEIVGPRARHCLVGTVHALPGSARYLPENLEACYARARRVMLEAIGQAMLDEGDYVRKLGQIAEPDRGGLRQRVGPELYQRFTVAVQEVGVDIRQFDLFRPWYAAEMLGAFRALRSLARAEYGVDQQLYWRAVRDRKGLVALETDQERAAVLTQMSDAAAVEHLAATLEDLSFNGGASSAAVALWLAGDENGLERMVADLRQRYPQHYRRLLADRNLAWLPRLKDVIDSDVPTLIAVGLGHVAGEESVRRQLWKEGIATTALRSAPPPADSGMPAMP